MAEGISIVGVTANQAGIEIEQLNGYIASMVGATGLSGNNVAVALKTIISRLYRIGSEGLTDEGKAEAQLNKLGIAVRNANGDFREFNSIMADLKKQWDGLTKVEKMHTAQVIGGTHHISKFVALMENFDTATEATAMALNSQGSAMAENEKYLDSIEGRMQQLTVTMETLFNETINSDTIKGLISGLDSLIQNFISLEKVVLYAVTAFMLFKGAAIWESLKLFATWIGVTAINLRGFIVNLLSARSAQTAFAIATRSTTGAVKALWVAFLNNPLGIVLGLITAITLAFSYFKKKQQENIESLQELTKQAKETRESFEKLTNTFYENILKVEKDEATKKKLLATEKELNKSISESKNKIDSQNKSLAENIILIEKQQKAEYNRYIAANELDIEASEKFMKKKVNPLSEGVDGFFAAFSDENLTIEEAKQLGFKTRKRKGGFGEETAILLERQELLKELNKIIENSQKLQKKGVSPETLKKVSNAVTKLTDDWKPYTEKLEENAIQQKNNATSTELTEKQLKKLNASQLKYYTVLKDTVDTEEEKLKLLNVLKSFKDTNFENVEQFWQALNKIDGIEISDDVKKKLTEMIDKTIEGISPARELASGLDNLTDSSKLLATAYGELEENQTLSLGTFIDLLKNYPEMLDNITFEGDMIKLNKDILVEKFEIEKQNFISKRRLQQEELENAKKATLIKLGLFHEEIAVMDKVNEKYKAIVSSAYKEAAKHQGPTPTRDDFLKFIDDNPAYKIIGEIESNLLAYESTNAQIEKSINFIKSLNLDDFKSDSSSGSGKDKTYEVPDSLKSDIDLFIRLTQVLNDVNRALAENAKMQEVAKTDSEMLRLKKEEVKLLEQKKGVLKDLSVEYENQAKLLKLTGVDVDSKGRVVEDTFEKEYNKRKTEIDSLTLESQKELREEKLKEFNEWKETVEKYREWIKIKEDFTFNSLEVEAEIAQKIAEIHQLETQMMIKRSEEVKKRIEEDLADISHAMAMTTSDAVKSKLLNDSVSILSTGIGELVEEYTKLMSVTDENIKQTEEYKNAVDGLEDSIQGYMQRIKQTIEDDLNARIKSVEDVKVIITNMIKEGIAQRKDALKEELDLYTEYMDEVIKQKQREFDEIDYEKDLKTELDKKQEIQNKINAISLDNSFAAYQRRLALEKELAEQTEKINDITTKKSRDIQIEELKATKETTEKDYKDRIDKIDEVWTEEKIALTVQKTLLSKNFDELKSHFPELFSSISSGFEDFSTIIVNFEKKFGGAIGYSADLIERTLIPKVNQAINDIKNLNRLQAQLSDGTAVNTALMNDPVVKRELVKEKIGKLQDAHTAESKKSNTDQDKLDYYARTAQGLRDEYGMDFEDLSGYKSPVQSFLDPYAVEKAKEKIGEIQTEWNLINEFAKRGLPYDSTRKEQLEKDAANLRKEYGLESDVRFDYRGYKAKLDSFASGGINTKTGLAMLHGTPNKPEYILNSQQFNNLVSNVASGYSLPFKNSIASKGSLTNNLTIVINGDADTSTVGKIKRAGKDILSNLKKTMNRNGTFR